MNIWVLASDGNEDAVKKYVLEGGDVNAKDEFGYTPLYVLVIFSGCAIIFNSFCLV